MDLKQNVMDLESATAEVEKWLDHKKVSAEKRAGHKDAIDILIDGLVTGVLCMTDDFHFIQKLTHPLGEKGMITELKFRPRIKVGDIQKLLTANKAGGDPHVAVSCYIAALTNQPIAVIRALDTEDYHIGQRLSLFFF